MHDMVRITDMAQQEPGPYIVMLPGLGSFYCCSARQYPDRVEFVNAHEDIIAAISRSTQWYMMAATLASVVTEAEVLEEQLDQAQMMDIIKERYRATRGGSSAE